MLDREEENQTATIEFILLGFGNLPELQPLLFVLFLIVFIMSLTGNLLIVLLIVADQQLHTPMYFFLGNLSGMETCYSLIILPKMLANLIIGERTISVRGCIAQFYFFGLCAGIETYLLAAMSYDRYLAICRPLHYSTIMRRRFCVHLMAATWINSLLANLIVIIMMAQLSFCGPNVIDHYFCDFIPIVKLSCSDTSMVEITALFFNFNFNVAPFLLTLTSYVCIIATILKIPSTTGRKKAFSTCSSHLIVVCIFYGTLIIVYMLPDSPTLRGLNKVFSIFYTILNPLVNPLIYSLRNQEVHKALRRVWKKLNIFCKA
ncbi:olfactory receptor 1361-like [Podarcis raffonei]|uniref:olfactory receptor 1361-like n=1 Tax=Podarcis raffonei TaxID=65483 RepID=UPI0023297B9F|nr:olfactory receptor 1361-like [Podarcis raffonei]